MGIYGFRLCTVSSIKVLSGILSVLFLNKCKLFEILYQNLQYIEISFHYQSVADSNQFLQIILVMSQVIFHVQDQKSFFPRFCSFLRLSRLSDKFLNKWRDDQEIIMSFDTFHDPLVYMELKNRLLMINKNNFSKHLKELL